MIISRTPMRASLFGGGTDLAGYYENSKYGYGAVLSTAINMYTYITVNKKFDDQIRVSYWKTEIVDRVENLEHNIIREALKIVGIKKGIEIVYMADIPLGSVGVGLASSSSLAVGVLNALYAFLGKHVSAERLAREACQIEIDQLKNPIGKQDQYAVAYGGLNYYQFNYDGSVFMDPLICKKNTRLELESHLLFFYTGTARQSSAILQEQNENIMAKQQTLDQLVEIAYEARTLLENNDISSVGYLLNKSWCLKRQLASKVSNLEIDEMYAKAMAGGAVGGKILGAGGGGFLMLFVPDPFKQSVRNALAGYKEVLVSFEPQGSKIIYVSE